MKNTSEVKPVTAKMRWSAWMLRILIFAGCCLWLFVSDSVAVETASLFPLPCVMMAIALKAEVTDGLHLLYIMLPLCALAYWSIDRWMHRLPFRYLFLVITVLQAIVSIGIHYYFIQQYRGDCTSENFFDLFH